MIDERNDVLVRSHTSESDISEDINEERNYGNRTSYSDMMDRAPNKLMRMEINLASERRDYDFFVYDKKVTGGVKITEHSLVFSRKKLEK